MVIVCASLSSWRAETLRRNQNRVPCARSPASACVVVPEVVSLTTRRSCAVQTNETDESATAIKDANADVRSSGIFSIAFIILFPLETVHTTTENSTDSSPVTHCDTRASIRSATSCRDCCRCPSTLPGASSPARENNARLSTDLLNNADPVSKCQIRKCRARVGVTPVRARATGAAAVC